MNKYDAELDFCNCGQKSVLPPMTGILKKVQDNILACAWVKQPNLAFSASLVIMATLISRKIQFGGMSPNLYVLNIAASGDGKDAPMQKAKECLIDMNADSLLGSGDYVSDASLMDHLPVKPVRLDILDEAGGILKTVNSGKGEHNGKMADVLAELWSCSTGYYMGRTLSEGNKGSCYRPNVNILASTTPTGFTEGVSIQAIEKGLLGRFLIFQGQSGTRAEMLIDLPHLDTTTLNRLRFWFTYEPPESDAFQIRGIKQKVTKLDADKEAYVRMKEIFTEFDTIRCSSEDSNPLLPIIARLYQQMIKIIIIHACSRAVNEVPVINKDDVEFGYLTIMHYFDNIGEIVEKYVFNTADEKNIVKLLNIIRGEGIKGISKKDLYKKARSIKKRDRDAILQELIETEQVMFDTSVVDGISRTVIKEVVTD